VNRSEKLEKYLLEDCTYTVLQNPENMKEVDFSSTPIPILKIFYQQGLGDYPDEQEAYFEPPKQDDFANAVFNVCKRYAEGEHSHNFRPETKDAWIQRSKKAWASMVRDVHFAYLMFEYQDRTDFYGSIKYDIDADIKSGADFILKHTDKVYHVNLYIDSSKSNQFYQRKKESRQPDKQAIDIKVPMTFNGSKKEIETSEENIWLYNNDHIEAVKDIVLGEKTIKKEGYILATN
jgi:uncharacterized phage-like protein YoqJ